MKKHCDCKRDEHIEENAEADLARRIAPEDVRPGMAIALLNIIREDLPFYFGCPDSPGDPAPVRTTWMAPDSGEPLAVVEVCLPFILVRTVRDGHRTLDVRRCTLVRLSDRYARRAFKRLRAPSSSSDLSC